MSWSPGPGTAIISLPENSRRPAIKKKHVDHNRGLKFRRFLCKYDPILFGIVIVIAGIWIDTCTRKRRWMSRNMHRLAASCPGLVKGMYGTAIPSPLMQFMQFPGWPHRREEENGEEGARGHACRWWWLTANRGRVCRPRVENHLQVADDLNPANWPVGRRLCLWLHPPVKVSNHFLKAGIWTCYSNMIPQNKTRSTCTTTAFLMQTDLKLRTVSYVFPIRFFFINLTNV